MPKPKNLVHPILDLIRMIIPLGRALEMERIDTDKVRVIVALPDFDSLDRMICALESDTSMGRAMVSDPALNRLPRGVFMVCGVRIEFVRDTPTIAR